MEMRKRLSHILIAISQFCWVIITLGKGFPDETISAASWRLEQKDNWFGKIARPIIDWIAFPFQRNHCQTAFISEQIRKQLPSEYFNFKREN